MIDSREYPPEEYENECGYCGEECNGEFCSKSCRRGYECEN
jgi:hypothetical protein